MKQHTIDKFNQFFKETLLNEQENNEPYCIIVPTTDNWDNPLPTTITNEDYIRLDIKDWSFENTYADQKGIYVKIAFDQDEYAKFFPYQEIFAILSSKGELIIQKPKELFIQEKIEQKQEEIQPTTSHTLKTIMHKETEGIKHSKSKLSLLKPKDKIKEQPPKKKKKKKTKKE